MKRSSGWSPSATLDPAQQQPPGFDRLKGDDNSRSVASWNAALPSKSPISPLPSSSLTDTERAGLFHTQPNLQCRLSAFIGVCNVADGVIE
jgi:hypothetical protein